MCMWSMAPRKTSGIGYYNLMHFCNIKSSNDIDIVNLNYFTG